ncbi:MAG: polymerase, sigma-24 subunit, subfamily [Rhodospirillales bacterium]|nr:polymerase, sigma-24 subunit, subfamily [Rhodospirillales bacterium]
MLDGQEHMITLALVVQNAVALGKFKMGKSPSGEDAKAQRELASTYVEVVPHLSRIGARRSLDGEEIAQDAVVRVLQARATTAMENPVRYLSRVARNLFVDAERVRARDRIVIEPAADLEARADSRPDPERALAGKERLEQAFAVIEDLPPRCRQAFRLHRFEGLSYVAIARQMGISPSMVEKHIAEAMLRLVRALGRDAD